MLREIAQCEWVHVINNLGVKMCNYYSSPQRLRENVFKMYLKDGTSYLLVSCEPEIE